MKVNEIFLSIQGEGRSAGLPTIFIRFTGCNLRCSYCDTKYAYYEGIEMSADRIMEKVSAFGYKRICITGGEPLLQKDILLLLERLSEYEVTIETNGSVSIMNLQLGEKHSLVMDIKTPCSGEENANSSENMSHLRDTDEIKIVVEDRSDYEFGREYLEKYYKKGQIIFSGVYDSISSRELVKWILEDRLEARFQIQLHKYIWGEDERGV